MPSLASSTATTNAATAPTSVKMENKTPANAPSSSLDVPESLKTVLTIVEKKVRNLEKRKARLDGYREELARGKPLDSEQRLAVARYDEVIQNLELARELTKQFDKIASDTSKEEKKRKKREAFEKQQSELARFKELFSVKEALACAVRSDSREHFLNGTQGAILLEEADLAKLHAFSMMISLDRPDLPGGFQEAVGGAAQHFQLLLEGRGKEVAGSSYKELKELLSRISKCAYFDWKAEVPSSEVAPTEAAPEVLVVQEEPVFEPANGEIPVAVESVPVIAAPVMTPAPAPPVVPLQAPASYFPVELNTDFNFIQDSLIECKAPIPAPTAAPVPVAAVPPVSLASMDSAVVMVHAQVPHGHPHPHHLAYSFIQGAPAPASLFHPAAHNPLSGVPQSMIQQPQPPIQQTNDIPVNEAEPLPQEPPQPTQEQPQAEQRSSPAWAEEVDDESQPFQQQQHKSESNTWTNSNYRSNDHEFTSRGRGGYRGRGGGRGGPRGGGSSGGQGNYFNSRGGSGGYGGSSEQRNNYYHNNSGGSQGNNGYRGRGGGGGTWNGARNNGGGGGYRGNGSTRGAPRGAPRGGYDRNN